ncbi:MAG: family 78 glycoside hydrolase catalytic domain [Clostridia bacterium]|nr:family 78 glycoside hydrolase catalytic domain [Clostridia bacterium]
MKDVSQPTWIWKNAEYGKDEFAFFQDEFDFESGKAEVKISVYGDYNLYINGALAAFGQVADYPHYKIYDTVDLTPYAVKGKNVLRIEARYQGVDCFTGVDFGAGVFYRVFVNGNTVAASRAGCKCGDLKYVEHRKKLITAQLGYSYTYDFSAAKNAGAAAEVAVQKTCLIARDNKRTFLGKTVCAAKIGENIYDLGAEYSGFLYFKAKIEKGARLTVAYGEHIADGKVRDKIGARDFTLEFIGSGKTEDFFGGFLRLGARYMQLYCDGGYTIEEIGVKSVDYPFEIKPFNAKTPLRQMIYDVSVRTLTLCAHERYEDCPWREQGTYILDSRNQMLCGYYAFRDTEMQKAMLKLMLNGQNKDGLFDICFPSRNPFTIPSFSLNYPTAFSEYAEHTGDLSFADDALCAIEKTLAFFKTEENGLFKTQSSPELWHFYEWSGDLDGNFFSEDPALKNRCGYDSLINAYLSIAYVKTAKIYRLCGNTVRAAELENAAEKLNASIRKEFFDEKSGLFKTYGEKEGFSVLANALCVLAGAAEENDYAVIGEFLKNPPETAVKNTLSMNAFRFDALLKINVKNSAFVLDEIERVYGKMLAEGATSFWETEKGEADFDGAGSLCHGWSAIPVYYFHLLNG